MPSATVFRRSVCPSCTIALTNAYVKDDPDARRGDDVAAVDGDWLVERLEEPGRRRSGGLLGRLVDEDRELVAAQSGHGVAGPYAGQQPLGGGQQEQVARCVAERVVDGLEAVEVEEEYADAGRMAAGGRQRVLDAVAEQ